MAKREYKNGLCGGSCHEARNKIPKPIVAWGLCRACYQDDYRLKQKEQLIEDLEKTPNVMTAGQQVTICAEIMAVGKNFNTPLKQKSLPPAIRIELEQMQNRLREITHELSRDKTEERVQEAQDQDNADSPDSMFEDRADVGEAKADREVQNAVAPDLDTGRPTEGSQPNGQVVGEQLTQPDVTQTNGGLKPQPRKRGRPRKLAQNE
jgi:hypothetical protein